MREMFVRRVDGLDVPGTSLAPAISWKIFEEIVPAQCVNENKLREDDRRPLEVNGLPRIVIQIADDQHRRIRIARCLR